MKIQITEDCFRAHGVPCQKNDIIEVTHDEGAKLLLSGRACEWSPDLAKIEAAEKQVDQAEKEAEQATIKAETAKAKVDEKLAEAQAEAAETKEKAQEKIKGLK